MLRVYVEYLYAPVHYRQLIAVNQGGLEGCGIAGENCVAAIKQSATPNALRPRLKQLKK
jgi:hypothetical protein